MAGEWLKMEACTPEKAEVLAITARMGWDDADLTVGKLFRLWRWFDQQTTNGNARGVTSALLDRVVSVSGFCEAMQSVGWLDIEEGGVSLPNFDRHNGNTAKNRALTAKRVANHKANAKGNGEGNAATVSDALPRKEKKREEKKDKGAPAPGLEERFDSFWKAYPKKTAKDDARKAFAKRKPDDDMLSAMLAALELQKASVAWTKDGGQFIPNPATWLNGGRWQDGEADALIGGSQVGAFV